MWTCPNCGHQFYNTNQSHSCGNYTVDDFLAGKAAEGVALFWAFIAEYQKIGEFALHPVKTRIALLTKMRFCSINKIGRGFIEFHLVLTRPLDSQVFFKQENFKDRFFVHHCRLSGLYELTDDLKDFMREAYQIGNREHIT